MRAVKLRAAVTNRKMKDVVADAITSGLAASSDAPSPRNEARRGKHATVRRHTNNRAATLDSLLEALFAEGDAMTAAGVDFKAWAVHSRDVWR